MWYKKTFQIVIVIILWAYCCTNITGKIHRHDDVKKLFLSGEDLDYDENYYKDVGNVADLPNRTYNLTEDTTNGDYLDELGSTTDDAFQNFNPDPYLDIQFTPNETTVVPTTTQHDEIPQVDFEVTEPPFNVINNVPNYSNETLPKCPDGYETYQSATDSTICFLEIAGTTYPPPCQHPNFLESEFLPYQIIGNRRIWSTPPRKIFDNFGPTFVTNTWKYSSNLTTCQITDGSNLIPKPCNDSHTSVCAFSYDNIRYSFDSYCRKRFWDDCVSADLGSGERCFCLVRSPQDGQHKNTFCNKLAEPLEPYHNLLLLKLLGASDTCWIGFDQDAESKIKWASTNLATEYTYWSFLTDFTKRRGAISHSAWSLESDGELNCAICEMEAKEHSRVHLYLKFNRETNKVRLFVDNALEVFSGIKCYSYGNEYVIDTTFNKLNRLEIDVYEVNDIPRYYWCKALQIPHLHAVYSNRILAQATSFNPGREYSVANAHYIPTSPYYMTQVIFNYTDNVLHHLHTAPTNYTLNEEIDFLAKFIRTGDIRSSEVCLESTTISNNQTLTWPETVIGATALPNVFCVQNNGYPVTRKCLGNFLIGGTWSIVQGACTSIIEVNEIQLYQKFIRAQNTKDPSVLETYTLIKYIVTISNFTQFIEGVNNLMNFPNKILYETQQLLNTTDFLLDQLKMRIAREVQHNRGFTNILLNNIRILNINLDKTKSDGIKFHSNHTFVIDNSDFGVLLNIPEQLSKDMFNCSSSNLIVTLLKNDALFGSLLNLYRVRGSVVLLTPPCNLLTLIKVGFNLNDKSVHSKVKCGSWNYGSNDLMENIHGSWSNESLAHDDNSYKMCTSTYDSYITLLEDVEEGSSKDSSQTKSVLAVFSIFVSVVSILSLIAVCLTTIFYKSYSFSHIAVVNLSIASTALITITFIVTIIKLENTCKIFAVALHYVTLVQFLWMTVIVWLQHQIFVPNKLPVQKLLLPICFLTWSIPLVLVIILASTSSSNYGKISYNVCYAMGSNFTYSVMLLVSILLFITLTIFAKIMASIRFSKNTRAHSVDISFSQLKIALLLYLVLGITWGLGTLTAIVDWHTIPYVYSLLACTQEIVIYLFFIALSEKTRTLWVSAKNICCMGKSKSFQLTPKRKKRKGKYSTSQF